jgi:hypothetical protein
LGEPLLPEQITFLEAKNPIPVKSAMVLRQEE